ncbi:hypothetical protein FHS31_002470 [Sphingomonas vulcanisoli]|uniref:MFS transporter n=1 Tax=Sphingomonas vulcanisoli TaxID=1658060 RepID=A0ABX0TYY1_9SPHN|nr:MFS transporter [Sphingomonas vulcanisoli]NIJ08846.1 hypothetical protein [Sphingomonas vulcanisoli]
MKASFRLLTTRRFLPLFATQFLGAFNDNLFKQAMILIATYEIYSNARAEATFSAIATGLFILPFFLFSALSGQLADSMDKTRIIRIVKTIEIGIMVAGSAGLLMQSIPLMLAAVLALGVHSTFFGPIKYALLPQHLEGDEVLGGTGLVEASTYCAILAGTILAGKINAQAAAVLAIVVAILGWITARAVPPAPPTGEHKKLDWHLIRSSGRLIAATMHIPRLFNAILAISCFWMIGSILIIEFPPLVKNVFTADKEVASIFLAIFSVGVAIGSVLINRLLGGRVSARYAAGSVAAMALFVVLMSIAAENWTPAPPGTLFTLREFLTHHHSALANLSLLGIAVTGGMFVVPLYAFLTTTVEIEQTARTVAANNIVNSGAMVVGALLAAGLTQIGVSIVGVLMSVAVMCIFTAGLAWRLDRSCRDHEREQIHVDMD